MQIFLRIWICFFDSALFGLVSYFMTFGLVHLLIIVSGVCPREWKWKVYKVKK